MSEKHKKKHKIKEKPAGPPNSLLIVENSQGNVYFVENGKKKTEMSEKHKKKKPKLKEKPLGSLNSLLIVENGQGNVFFVENEKKKSKSVKKLLKKKLKKEKKRNKSKSIPMPVPKTEESIEIKDEPPESDHEAQVEGSNLVFTSTSQNNIVFIEPEVKVKTEPVTTPAIEVSTEKLESTPALSKSKKDSNSDEDDDFTWDQDEGEDNFLFGAHSLPLKKRKTTNNSYETAKNTPNSTSKKAKIEPRKSKADLLIEEIKELRGEKISKPETKPEINTQPAKKIPQEKNLDFGNSDDSDKDFTWDPNNFDDFEWDSSDDNLLQEKSQTKQEKSKSSRKNLKEILKDYQIKRDSKQIEERKKQKMTGKKGCKYCSTIFKTKSELDSHKCEYLKCDPDKYICRICSKELFKKSFTSHAYSVHGEHKLKCSYCSKTFKENTKLKLHLATHTGDYAHKCTMCTSSFSSFHSLKRHMAVHGIEAPEFQCQYCKKKFAYNYTLKNHISQAHTREKVHTCDKCGSFFARKVHLVCHMKSVHLHLRPHICSACGVSYKSPQDLKRHFERKHENYKPAPKFECPYCKKLLAEAKTLRSHIALHTGERKFFCDKCGVGYYDGEKLKRHKCNGSSSRKREINNDIHFEKYCRYCDTNFDKWIEKNEHQCGYVKNSSDPKKFYICRFCDKEYLKAVFTSHSAVHSTATFKCSLCPKFYKRKETLNKHMKTHRSGGIEFKFSCDLCSKSFLKKEILLKHLETNHNVVSQSKLSCKYCCKQFFSEKRLNYHIKRVHEHPEQFPKRVLKRKEK